MSGEGVVANAELQKIKSLSSSISGDGAVSGTTNIRDTIAGLGMSGDGATSGTASLLDEIAAAISGDGATTGAAVIFGLFNGSGEGDGATAGDLSIVPGGPTYVYLDGTISGDGSMWGLVAEYPGTNLAPRPAKHNYSVVTGRGKGIVRRMAGRR